MKRIFFSFYALFFCGFVFAQYESKFTILDNNYSYEYNEASRNFSICKKTSDNKFSCELFKIAKYDQFSTPIELKDFINSFFKTEEFNTLGQKVVLNQIEKDISDIVNASTDFSATETSTELNGLLKNPIEKDTTYIKDGLKSSYFLVSQKDNSNYIIESEGDLKLFDPFEFPFANELKNNQDTFTDEIQKQIRLKLEANKEVILKTFFSRIESIYHTNLRNFFKTKITKSETYTFLTSKELIPNGSVVKSFFGFHYLVKGNAFYLESCKNSDSQSCATYGLFSLNIDASDFVQKVYAQHNQFKSGDDFNTEALKRIFSILKLSMSNARLKKENEEFQNKLAKTVDSIERQSTNYSGQLVLAKSFDLNILIKGGGENVKFLGIKVGEKDKKSLYTKFLVDYATVHFFNNRADKIAIAGHLANEENRTQVLINKSWSLPLRELNSRDQSNETITKNGKQLRFVYDDVLDYLPTDRHNYAIQNGNVKLIPGDTIKLKERKIGDYFTGVFFSDFLGLNSNNTNSLIVAEGRIRVPWNLRNMGKWTMMDNLSAYVSVVLVGDIENSSRRIDLGEFTLEDLNGFESDNFNLLRSNNIDAGIQITPLTFEWKGASTFIHTRYGLRFLRTGAEYNLLTPTTNETGETIDNIQDQSFQIYSIGQEAELNFEIRPQSTIGIDLTIGLNWFGSTGTNDNEINFRTTNNSYNLKVLANLFSLVNPDTSKSGVFVRIGGHYNHGNSEIFPQIMVGYATNLTSFVNKFKSNQSN